MALAGMPLLPAIVHVWVVVAACIPLTPPSPLRVSTTRTGVIGIIVLRRRQNAVGGEPNGACCEIHMTPLPSLTCSKRLGRKFGGPDGGLDCMCGSNFACSMRPCP